MKTSIPTTESSEQQLNRALDMLRQYKAREEHIVLGLGEIQKSIMAGRNDALGIIRGLMASSLKDAANAAYNKEFALKMAVAAIEGAVQKGHLGEGILDQLMLLVPEQFVKAKARA